MIEQWEIDKRLKEFHAKLFYEDLFEGMPKLKRVIFPEIIIKNETVAPLELIPLNFPEITLDI